MCATSKICVKLQQIKVDRIKFSIYLQKRKSKCSNIENIGQFPDPNAPVFKGLTETSQIPEKFIVDLIRRKNESRIELAVLVVNKSMAGSQGSKK